MKRMRHSKEKKNQISTIFQFQPLFFCLVRFCSVVFSLRSINMDGINVSISFLFLFLLSNFCLIFLNVQFIQKKKQKSKKIDWFFTWCDFLYDLQMSVCLLNSNAVTIFWFSRDEQSYKMEAKVIKNNKNLYKFVDLDAIFVVKVFLLVFVSFPNGNYIYIAGEKQIDSVLLVWMI